jgi:aminoglycoside 3-N-acetyltransferase
MANTGLVQKIFGKFPFVEIIARKIYWRNINFILKVFYPKRIPKTDASAVAKISIARLFTKWQEWGIQPGDIILLTSSYAELQAYQMEPEEILDEIIRYLGSEGTLVMPAFPYFKNMPKNKWFLKKDINNEVFKYDPKKNLVTTGLLPGTLVRYAGSVRSSFPINSLVALGKYANEMFLNEWSEKNPLPCGKGSAWEFCAEKNAKIISLGTDLTHSLTMIHVAEDTNQKWPVTSWYRNKKFLLSEGGITKEILLRERHPRWGTLNFAERKLCSDLITNNLMLSTTVDGVLTEKIDSRALLNFLNQRNQNGYPYYCIPGKNKTR